MVQWVQGLLGKHEDLTLKIQKPQKSGCVGNFVKPMLLQGDGRLRQDNPWKLRDQLAYACSSEQPSNRLKSGTDTGHSMCIHTQMQEHTH